MSKLLVCLTVLVVVLNNVSGIPLFGNLIANLRTLEQSVADQPPNVQERILASYLHVYASHFPMAWSNDDSLTDYRRTLINRRDNLGVDRPGVRESAKRYLWNRRGYIPEKDIERFLISQELKERRDVPLEN